MNKGILLLQIFLMIVNVAKCQIQMVDSVIGLKREVYSKDSQGRLTGEYKFYYDKLLQVQGYYDSGLKTGKWVFQSDPSFRFVGYYKKDQKDSVWNYYLNGQLVLFNNFKTGERIGYYPNGKLQIKGDSVDHQYRLEEYSLKGKVQKMFLSDTLTGHSIEYDKKGRVTEEIYFKKGVPYNILMAHKNTVYGGNIKDGSGTLFIKSRGLATKKLHFSEKIEMEDALPNGVYEKYSEDGSLLVKGMYSKGVMIDKWEKYDSKSKKLKKEVSYSKEKGLKRDTIESIGFYSGAEPAFAEAMPVFMGEPGYTFVSFLYGRLKYPQEAINMDIEGRVVIQFVVNSIGKVTDVKLITSANDLLDNEAMKLVAQSPYWRPGMQNGKAVSVYFTLPVVFSLKK
jgi:TonB family protein